MVLVRFCNFPRSTSELSAKHLLLYYTGNIQCMDRIAPEEIRWLCSPVWLIVYHV